MTPEQLTEYPAVPVTLRNGCSALIRPLAPDDAEALVEFYAVMPREDLRFYYPHHPDRDSVLRYMAEVHSPLNVSLVLAQPDGRLGGLAFYRWSAPEAERSTFGICIAREYQGCGAGRLLMTHLLDIARHLGPPVMTLTVQQANTRAVALYQSFGFTIVREQILSRDPSLGFADEPEYAMERPVR